MIGNDSFIFNSPKQTSHILNQSNVAGSRHFTTKNLLEEEVSINIERITSPKYFEIEHHQLIPI